ncbi:hypothetical protein ACT3UQ_05205 [Glutamicibacter sp. AOP12-B1-11]|uniref:hypothetical protein n=1 Tax=Glutamicibacter sp. AOP12-B1-11 TaxID=3457725 RepID=UPI004033B736
MYRKISAIAAIGLSLTLVACSPSTTTAQPSLEAPPVTKPVDASPSPSPTPSSTRSDRGNLVKEMGQASSWLNAAKEPTVNFRVDWIKANATCNDDYFPEPAKGMKRIEVHLTVETTKALADGEYSPTITFSPFLWKYIDANGQTYGGDIMAADGIRCESKPNPLPDEFGPAEKGKGWIMMDVPDLEGTLIYNQPGFEYDLAKALKK